MRYQSYLLHPFQVAWISLQMKSRYLKNRPNSAKFPPINHTPQSLQTSNTTLNHSYTKHDHHTYNARISSNRLVLFSSSEFSAFTVISRKATVICCLSCISLATSSSNAIWNPGCGIRVTRPMTPGSIFIFAATAWEIESAVRSGTYTA
jgi:hypothetical protein